MDVFMNKYFSNGLGNKNKLINDQIAVSSSSSVADLIDDELMKIEEISIPVPWGVIRGVIFGGGGLNVKPMVCVHGYLDNANSFKPLATHLTRTNEYYLIALDLPGHGRSSKLPSSAMPYTPKFFTMSLRHVVRFLKLAKFYFLCHSYGIAICFMVKNHINKNLLLLLKKRNKSSLFTFFYLF